MALLKGGFERIEKIFSGAINLVKRYCVLKIATCCALNGIKKTFFL